MANDFFQFKHFTIYQDKCAMKVSTLACIQGAWLPDFSPKNILDIGAGTGVLSLMASQKYQGLLDAVEIEPDAFSQLQDNIMKSPWYDRISCHRKDIRNFTKCTNKRYDFIISNPPFFDNQLKSPNQKINQARHDTGLILEDLIDTAASLLNDRGKISILLPYFQTQKLINLCQSKSLYISDQLVISDMVGKPVSGVVSMITNSQRKTHKKKLFIKTKNGNYSRRFTLLMKDYYLNL